MKKLVLSVVFGVIMVLAGCHGSEDSPKILKFSTSAEYPPFEYKQNGELVGFDIELGGLIAQELGLEAQFQDMQFSTTLMAVQSGMADAAIATITITPERTHNFDFSDPYYVESLAMIYPKDKPITQESALAGKTIACQLGTTMEYWLKEHNQNVQVVTFDNNPQAVEALKAGHVEGVLIDEVQAHAFTNKNPNLSFKNIAHADTGYGIAFRKGSPMVAEVNRALKSLTAKGDIDKLKQKYLEAASWNKS